MDTVEDKKHITPNIIDFEPERLNRFLVRFPSELDIQEWWMVSFKKPLYYFKTKTYSNIEFNMKAAYSSNSEDWHPYMKDSEVIKNFEKYNDMNCEYVDFDELDATGKCISKIRYSNPKFISIRFDEYNYANDNSKGYTLEMSFDDIIEFDMNKK